MNFFEAILEGISQPKNYFFFTHYLYLHKEKFYSLSDLEERVIDFAFIMNINSEECVLYEVIDEQKIQLRSRICAQINFKE